VNSDQIRQSFIDFFVERGHLHLPSLGLVPVDPGITTLFTIAGMQQMIPYFMGREEPPSRRIVTVQRSVRTVDIGEVGDDTHLTLLEMLGNFSVGDYFKREAIRFTWDFLTGVMGIPGDRWWATIYPGDEEARQAWLDVGMPPERIGETEANWWDQGPVGPCGTDSEVHYDRGIELSCGRPDCRPENECCGRFIETWNNVFMVYYQNEDGERSPLPWNNIDTGMGFERLVTIVQGKASPYETDIFMPIIERLEEISGRSYESDASTKTSFRIIADHSRTIGFTIADGVMPSAEGRGYVLRRLLRRAVMRGRLLGIERPFLTEPVGEAMTKLSGYYRELDARREHVLNVVRNEEERFLHTLSRGLAIFEETAERAGPGGEIEGADAFLLSDTYGFPLELTVELAADRGLRVDEPGFAAALADQQKRARAGRKFSLRSGTPLEAYTRLLEDVDPTVFTGYEELSTTADIAAILAEGQPVGRAQKDDEVELVLTATPFYAESGGQVGDTGTIRTDNGLVQVIDTQRPVTSLIVHRAIVLHGSIAVGDVAQAQVDTERRLHILPHHSGTHLLHKALQEVLGPDATQAGSLVAPDRLRFDFRWPRALTDEELREVQDRVNAAIWANLPVRKEIKPYDQAVREGAMALFGEKYGDFVRVVTMGDWSKELCGGTHVSATGDIGLLVITGESGIGSGVRRIEAVAGAAAYAYLNELRDQLRAVTEALDTRPDALVIRAHQLIQDAKDREKRIEDLTRRLATREAEALLRDGLAVDGFTVVANTISADTTEYLRATTDAVKMKLESGIVVLGSVVNGKGQYTLAVTRNLKDRGYNAGALLREAAQQAKAGGAGGNPEFATGGGEPSKVPAVVQAAVDVIKRRAET
jgi:alanyl-tRNA synthetase